MKKFPIVKARGTNYEVGTAIGETLEEHIAQTLSRTHNLMKLDKGKLHYLVEPYLDFTKKYFPNLAEECQGISDGSGISFDEVFLGNVIEAANPDKAAYLAERCSIIAVKTDEGYILGHNEDAYGYEVDDIYLLDAEISGNHIFGFSYVDGLIGSSVAINGYGLIQAINSIPNYKVVLGIPRNIIARAVLDCKTLEEAEKLLSSVPRASGYNHVLAQGHRLWNIESSYNDTRVYEIEDENYVHTNHTLTDILKGKDIESIIDLKKSKTRYNKLCKLLPDIKTVEDIKKILSDKNEPAVSREGTIGSIVFDAAKSVADICYGRSKYENYYEYSFKEVYDKK
ncbi:C45 family autoproteolytic acyltransferase/hydrolase [Patescibacteria group bacterium]